MTIIEKLITSIKDALGDNFPVYYHNEETLNVIADNADYPCAFVYLLETGDLVEENGVVKEEATFAVHFVELTDFDYCSMDNEAIISRCKRRALQWVNNLSKDRYFTLEDIGNTQRTYEAFDTILTGFGVLLTLKELESEYCVKEI